MIDLAATIPPVKPHESTESWPWTLDTTPMCDVGETPTNVVMSLIDLATNLPGPAVLTGSPSVAGKLITQTVGKGLLPGHSYLLIYSFDLASGKSPSPALRLECTR